MTIIMIMVVHTQIAEKARFETYVANLHSSVSDSYDSL